MSPRTSVRIKDVTTYVNRGVAPTYVDEPSEWVAFNQKCVRPDGSTAPELGRPMADPGASGRTAVLRPGDVCVNSTGRGTLGRAGFIDEATAGDRKLVADGHVTVLRSDPRRLEPRYLWYLLCNERFYAYANTCLAVGSTNQTELGRDQLRTLAADLPPLEVQRRIVEYLDAETARIDDLIAEQLRLVDYVRERHHASIASGTKFTEDRQVMLKRVCVSIQTGTTPSTSEPRYYENGSIPWFGPSSTGSTLTAGQPSKLLADLAVREGAARLFPAGASMMVTIGATIGRTAQLPVAGSCNQQITVLVPRPDMDARFLAWSLVTVGRRVAEVAPNTTLPIYTQTALGREMISVPDPATQRRTAERLDESELHLVHVSREVEVQVALLREHRQALITAAVTGGLEAIGRVA